MRSLGHTKVSSGSLGLAWLHSAPPSGRRVHSGSRGFIWTRLEDFGFIRVRMGILRRVCVAGFIGFRVGSLVRAKGSPGSLGLAWVHSCAPNVRPVHSVFTRALLKFARFIRDPVSSLVRG